MQSPLENILYTGCKKRIMGMKLNQAGPHSGSGTLVFHDSSWNCTDGPIEVLRDIDTAAVTVSDTSDQHVILGLRSEQEDSIFMAHLGIVASRRWVCSAKNKLWWMTPSWGSDISYLPIETQVWNLLMDISPFPPDVG